MQYNVRWKRLVEFTGELDAEIDDSTPAEDVEEAVVTILWDELRFGGVYEDSEEIDFEILRLESLSDE